MPSEAQTEVAPEDLFVCRQCGDCCRGYGGTFLGPRDIDAIAAFIGSSPENVVKNCCTLSGGKPLLAQKSDGYCIFWEEQCTIHPVKPRMCRQWPFIESVLVDPGNWEAMAGACPGMNTGFSHEQVKACTRRRLQQDRP